ncbi:GCN5 family acetyltransferase [Gordonia alkaliphila]|uniref:GNAT family N-acetyltransferase, cg3035/Rv0428c family n=1 Tax=Gordonia alkaliphila TaxID=1053547 RepID=UPI001FF32A66|nr:GCN5 family acetyltransferase [Gordonia alkaliphila]MCK0438759.1 GCN5 family acetyltransferase [Gordonia alkaliphila]
MADPLVGDRVVVRYRLGAGGPADWRATPNPAPTPARSHAPTLSDLTGLLIDASAERLILERDGVAETVPTAAIVSIRQLSTRTVRNSAIRTVERTLTETVPAAARVEFDGWLLSADPTSEALRANAAVPAGFGAHAAAAPQLRAWYAERGAPTRIVVPDRLLRLADLTDRAGDEYEVLIDPTDAPVQVPVADRAERLRLRAAGHWLHHTFTLIEL